MNPKKILLTAALAISAVFISLLFIDEEATAKAEPGKMTVPVVKEVIPGEGKKAPDFTWEVEGKEMKFSKVTKGKVAFVNFWATWCPPCRREIPDIIKLNKDINGTNNDIVFIGIGLDRGDDANSKLVSYINSANFNYPVYHESTGKLAQAFGGADAIPTTYIVNKKGEIVEKIVGMRSYEDFENSLKMAMLK